MSTLRDLRLQVQNPVSQMMGLFGCTAEFATEYNRRLREIGDALRFANGYSQEKAMALPEETELEENSETKFAELKRWLATQHEGFKKFAAA